MDQIVGKSRSAILCIIRTTTNYEKYKKIAIFLVMSGKDAGGKKKYKVCIIGAGAAGLSAANSLVKNGIQDFIVLEARNRIGGRILSLDIGATSLELGANWIHGVLGNPIFELAISHGLIDILQAPYERRVVALTEDGKQVRC